MKVVLVSMPDVVPIIIHKQAIHMPNHGIACVGGNIDDRHQVYLIDLIQKRNVIRKYLLTAYHQVDYTIPLREKGSSDRIVKLNIRVKSYAINYGSASKTNFSKGK